MAVWENGCSDMNDINHHLATVVMGWTQGETEFQWNDENGNRMLDGIRFDPLNNIEQAMGCRDTFVEWEIFKDHDYFVLIDPYEIKDNWTKASDPLLSKAICLACAKATGWKDA